MNPEAGLINVNNLNFSLGYNQGNNTLRIFNPQSLEEFNVKIYSSDGRLIQNSNIDGTKEDINLKIESILARAAYIVNLTFRQNGHSELSSWSKKLYIGN